MESFLFLPSHVLAFDGTLIMRRDDVYIELYYRPPGFGSQTSRPRLIPFYSGRMDVISLSKSTPSPSGSGKKSNSFHSKPFLQEQRGRSRHAYTRDQAAFRGRKKLQSPLLPRNHSVMTSMEWISRRGQNRLFTTPANITKELAVYQQTESDYQNRDYHRIVVET